MQCSIGCERLAQRGGLCWACLKARTRNGTTKRKVPQRGARYGSGREMLVEAAIALADADDSMLETAWHRLRMAVLRFRRRVKTIHKQTKNTHH